MKLHKELFLLLLLLLVPGTARAEDSQMSVLQGSVAQLQQMVLSLQSSMTDLKTTVENQNEVIRQQAVQIETLQRGGGAPGTNHRSGTGGIPGTVSKAVGNFNPDIAVVGTTQAKLTQNKADE